MDELLSRQGIGSFFRSFSLNSPHHPPQMPEKMGSIPHSPRYGPHNATAS